MTTRSIIKVRKNGKNWVSQYCQNDGYPTGQGVDVFEFVNRQIYVRWLDRAISNGDIIPLSIDEYNDAIDDLIKFQDEHPMLKELLGQMYRSSVFYRETGAKALSLLAKDFGKRYTVIQEPDPLWEVYMYTINLDNETVRIEELRGKKRIKAYSFDTIRSLTADKRYKLLKDLEEEWK